MYNGNPFEKTRLRDRFKDISTLAAFTLAVALISLVIMNILIYPLTIFAVKKKELFNYIITDLSLFAILIALIAMLSLKVYRLKKDGLDIKSILAYLVRRPFYYLSLFFFFALISSGIIFFLYVILSYNYYLLYKISMK